jgi:hypothetical protein
MAVNEDTWKLVQKHLGYTDEEMLIFRADPRNEDALSKSIPMLAKTFVAEVVESHGCDSGHKVGDKLYFDGRGISLLTRLGPSRIWFRRFGCPDVGIQCGGWGHIVMEIRMEDRKS